MAKRCCMLGLLLYRLLPQCLSPFQAPSPRTPSPRNACIWKFNRSQEPTARNVFPILRCEERQVGREGPAHSLCHDSLLAADTALLVPCCP